MYWCSELGQCSTCLSCGQNDPRRSFPLVIRAAQQVAQAFKMRIKRDRSESFKVVINDLKMKDFYKLVHVSFPEQKQHRNSDEPTPS